MFSPAERKLTLPSCELFLDVKGSGTTFVSHAHADHAVKSASTLICSPETLALLKCRNYFGKKTQVTSSIEGVGVSLHEAGHVFGSKQILVENGHKFLYTGDFRTSPSRR